jgi:hypothetical protein
MSTGTLGHACYAVALAASHSAGQGEAPLQYRLLAARWRPSALRYD